MALRQMTTTNQIRVAVFNYRFAPEERLEEKALPVLLSPREGKRYRQVDRRKAFFAGRACAALLFSEMALPARIRSNEEFGYLEVTDPEGNSLPNFWINISHTDGFAAAAVASCPIGIDAESDGRQVKDVVLDRISTFLERARLSGLSPIRIWSAKEAASKATGLGIKFGMRAFVLSELQQGLRQVDLKIKGPLSITNPFLLQRTYGEYVLSICTDRSLLEREILLYIVPNG